MSHHRLADGARHCLDFFAFYPEVVLGMTRSALVQYGISRLSLSGAFDTGGRP